MCLRISKIATQRLRNRLKREGEITAWKVLYLSDELTSLHQSQKVWVPEINWSDRSSLELDEEEQFNQIVVKGIHVFLDEERAVRSCEVHNWLVYDNSLRIVSVRCRQEHLVAAGDNWDAVFLEVTLSEEEYAKAIRPSSSGEKACQPSSAAKLL